MTFKSMRNKFDFFILFNSKSLSAVYVRDPKENGKLQLIGNWNGQLLNCRTMSMFPRDRLSNLFGKALKASSFEYSPYTYIVDTVDGDIVYDGVEVSFINQK